MSRAQGPPEGLWLRRQEALITGKVMGGMKLQRQNWMGHLPSAPGRPHPPAAAAVPGRPRALPESPPRPQGGLTLTQENPDRQQMPRPKFRSQLFPLLY